MTTSVVDNGVNVEALLGARDAFADAPEIAQFQSRSAAASPQASRPWHSSGRSSFARCRPASPPRWTFTASSGPTPTSATASAGSGSTTGSTPTRRGRRSRRWSRSRRSGPRSTTSSPTRRPSRSPCPDRDRAMRYTTTVIIGAGHCGLAMSRCLADRSVDHVVLERGEVANSWRTQRWDSLRLLTPNWQCRLPGYAYEGDDPDGFMTMSEVVDFVAGYA